MCGRFTLMLPWADVAQLLGVPAAVHGKPSFNIAPTQIIAIIGNGQFGRELVSATWGLEVPWTPRPLINIRSETILGKAFIREALETRRVLIPATGFYEWSEVDGKRRPYHFARPDKSPFVFASVGMFQRTEGGITVRVAILTTGASAFMQPFHDRMPVIMEPDTWDRWLDCTGTSAAEAVQLLRPVPEDYLVAMPVSTRVNSVKNDDATLVEREEVTIRPAPGRLLPSSE